MLPVFMILAIFICFLMGFPVAFTLGGVALIFAFLGSALDVFNLNYLNALPGSVYGVMTSDLLIAVPLLNFQSECL